MSKGRPLTINEVIEIDEAMVPVTRGEVVCRWLAQGTARSTSAAAAGIDRHTLEMWLREGARIAERVHLDPTAVERLDDQQAQLLDFHRRAHDALARAETTAVQRLQQLMEGGLLVERVVEKRDADGKLLEKTTTTEHTLPSERAVMWFLERRFPEAWGPPRQEIAVGAADPLTQGERAGMLADALEEALARGELDGPTTGG